MDDKLTLTLDNGAKLTLRPLVAKETGNIWFSVTKGGKAINPKFGVEIEAMGTTLPTTVSLSGPGFSTGTISLESYTSQSGKPAVKVNKAVGDKMLDFRVSDLGNGRWNMTAAKVYGKAGRKPGQTRTITKLDD